MDIDARRMKVARCGPPGREKPVLVGAREGLLLTMLVARDFANRGICCNSISPGGMSL